MKRFFFDPEQQGSGGVFLSEEESHHAVKVLRLKSGASVELLDGLGKIFAGTIVQTGRRVNVQIESLIHSEKQPQTPIRLLQSILKAEKMDMVVQKSTELGVDEFVPVLPARFQGKLSTSQADKKLERWRRISIEACKQSLRARPMLLQKPQILHQALAADLKDGKKLLFWEEEETCRMADLNSLKNNTLTLLLGPEGGFTREEVEAARLVGFETVSLGKRILRAETATISAVTLAQFLVGNL